MSKFSFENIHFKNDFDKIKKSFLLNLKIKISKKFYLWRYLKNNKFLLCCKKTKDNNRSCWIYKI